MKCHCRCRRRRQVPPQTMLLQPVLWVERGKPAARPAAVRNTATHPWDVGADRAAGQELQQHGADELQEQGHGKGSAGDGLVGVVCRARRCLGRWATGGAAAPAGTSSHPEAHAARLGRCAMQTSTTHRYHHGPCSALRGLHGMARAEIHRSGAQRTEVASFSGCPTSVLARSAARPPRPRQAAAGQRDTFTHVLSWPIRSLATAVRGDRRRRDVEAAVSQLLWAETLLEPIQDVIKARGGLATTRAPGSGDRAGVAVGRQPSVDNRSRYVSD
jgi:hypothetical protein